MHIKEKRMEIGQTSVARSKLNTEGFHKQNAVNERRLIVFYMEIIIL